MSLGGSLKVPGFTTQVADPVVPVLQPASDEMKHTIFQPHFADRRQ
jgi:hypothetical protein